MKLDLTPRQSGTVAAAATALAAGVILSVVLGVFFCSRASWPFSPAYFYLCS